MIKYTPASDRSLALFRSPFEQELDPDNRWVQMAGLVAWDDMAKIFFSRMSPDQGRASIDLRVVLGALLVKHIEDLSDEDTIGYIQENIYAQYFVGLSSFQTDAVFVPHLFVEIRKRLGKEGVQKLNDELLKHARNLRAIRHRAKVVGKNQGRCDGSGEYGWGDSSTGASQDNPGQGGEAHQESTPPNRGTLKLDATVAPQHVGYPTDTKLLHQGRLYSEGLIDRLYLGSGLWDKKPRTYRRVAHKQYLVFAKKRNPTKREIARTRAKQLRYLRRNLGHINRMLDELAQVGQHVPWQLNHWHRLWVLGELYRQQQLMHEGGHKRIDHRIVNIAQPYVRPIKRGKAGKQTEFGAKLNMSETEGFVRMDQLSFDNFNEGTYLQQQVKGYRDLYGYYPELILVDKIYLNRENRKFLKEKGIRHSGKPLGKAPQWSYAQMQKRRKEQNKRSEIEGKFGQAKSKYGLDHIKTRRKDTSYAHIGLILMALNIIKLGGVVFLLILMAFDRLWKKVNQTKAQLNHIFEAKRMIGLRNQNTPAPVT